MHKLLKIFIGLNILDLIFTYIVLSNPTQIGVNELNSIYAYLFKSVGMLFALLLIKIVGIILMIILFNHTYKQDPSTISKFMIIINISYVLLVINNIFWVYKTFKYLHVI